MDSRKNGTCALATLALEYATKIWTHAKISRLDLRTVIDTAKAVQWSKEIILRTGPKPINKLCQRLRNAGITPIEYSDIQNLLTGPIQADNLQAESWTIWGEMILKYDL